MRKFWAVSGLIIILCAVAWVAVLSQKPPHLAQKTLQNGIIVRLEKVTYGTNHLFTRGFPTLQRAASKLPAGFARLFGQAAHAESSLDEPMLGLWYSAFDPVTNSYVRLGQEDFFLRDEHGCSFRIGQFGGGIFMPHLIVDPLWTEVFPRRQSRFTLNAKFPNVAAVDLEVVNPLSTNYPLWKPEPLPAKRQVEEWEFVLRRIDASFDQIPYVFSANFKIREGTQDRTQWFEPQVRFEDATGNSHHSTLCPFEPAWKVRAHFYRNAEAQFPTNTPIWRLPDLEIPKAGEVKTLGQLFELQGAKVLLYAIAGPGDYVFSNGVWVTTLPLKKGDGDTLSLRGGRYNEMRFRSKSPSLLVNVDGVKEPERMLIRAIAGDQKIGARDNGSVGKDHYYRFSSTPDAKSMTLEFIKQKPIELEYLVAPPPPPAERSRATQ